VKKNLIFSAAMILFLSATQATADNVLLLGDGDAETQVQAALEAAGHTVTYAGIYYDWDGVTPDVSSFDVVVFLNGYDYGYELQPAAAAALQTFVAGGCGLVMGEWTAYDVCSGYKGAIVDSLMPVTMSDCGDYGYGETWTVDSPGHPLVAGLPASWSDPAGWSTVTPKPGTTVVVSDSLANPMVAYSNASGGTVVYLNHDMTYSTSPISAEAIQLLVNSVEFSSCAALVAVQVPTIQPWGVAALILSLLAAAFWSIKRAGI
jgi:uncharacterized membrane protein